MKKWITFDLDETIMQNPFKKHVFPEIIASIENSYRQEIDVMDLIYDEHLLRMSNNRVLESYDWDDIVNELITKLKLHLQIDVEKIVVNHSTSPKIYLLEEDMLESLEKMRQVGYSLAAATNGYYKYQIPVIEELKLSQVFEKVITSDIAGCAKPDTQMLSEIMKESRVIAHVGDRIDHDVLMANNLDITSVLINKHLPSHVLEFPLNERRNDDSFVEFCQEKWQKENKYRGES